MKHETTKHYSQEPELFESFLDPYMKYSSAWFADWEEPLDTAVLRMLDKILDLSQIRDGARVLEIGNGWGSLVRRLRERFVNVDYTGVNPSRVQLDWIAEHVDTAGSQINAPFEDVMDELVGPYNTIYMIGALCHMKDKQKVMSRVAELLSPEGNVILEDTFFLSEALYQAHVSREETRYVQDTIFGYAHVYSIARHHDELRNAGLQVMRSETNSDHYARTIEIWTDRLRALDPRCFELAPHFIAYMDVFQRGWNHTICNQLQTITKLPQRRRRQVASLPS